MKKIPYTILLPIVFLIILLSINVYLYGDNSWRIINYHFVIWCLVPGKLWV